MKRHRLRAWPAAGLGDGGHRRVLHVVAARAGTRKAFIRAQKNATPEQKRAIVRENVFGYFPLGALYYGDVEPGNVVQQTQVWTAWWLAPLHLFCFNFGGTHAIHHFVIRDPFYLRQATAKRGLPDTEKAWRALRQLRNFSALEPVGRCQSRTICEDVRADSLY